MTQKRKSLASGVAILGISGVLCKIIGAVFKIPLVNSIGTEGMGIFSGVYANYTLLLAISTAGIPVAISRLVAESVTLGHYKQARQTLKTAFWLLLLLGSVLTLLLVVFARPISVMAGDESRTMGFIAIAPSILLVSMMSAFRGYMQGRSRMVPTAVSQLIEQLAKVMLSLPLATLAMRRYGIAEAAAAALVGISIGEAIALVYVVIIYYRGRPEFLRDEQGDTRAVQPSSEIAKRLIRIAVPIVIGASVVPLAGSIDSQMILRRLLTAGFGDDVANAMYGLHVGSIIPVVNIPTALATAVCISLVPIISSARIERRLDDMTDASNLGMRLASLIGFPCAMGMALLSTEIVQLIYYNFSPEETLLGGQILRISAWSIIVFTHVQSTTGILQGLGMQKVPMYSLMAGMLCKVILNYILVAIPGVNIFGASIASIVCYTTSMAINILWIMRRANIRFRWGDILLRPAIAAAGMGAVVLLLTQVLDMARKRNTFLAIAAGVVVYAILVFAIGALRRDDMDQMPGGQKLEKLLTRIGIWR